MPKIKDQKDLAAQRDTLSKEREARPMRLTLSSGTCGQASGSLAVLNALKEQLSKAGLDKKVHVRVTGCQGFCEQEPLLILEPLDVLYCRTCADHVGNGSRHRGNRQPITNSNLFRVQRRGMHPDALSPARTGPRKREMNLK